MLAILRGLVTRAEGLSGLVVAHPGGRGSASGTGTIIPSFNLHRLRLTIYGCLELATAQLPPQLQILELDDYGLAPFSAHHLRKLLSPVQKSLVILVIIGSQIVTDEYFPNEAENDLVPLQFQKLRTLALPKCFLAPAFINFFQLAPLENIALPQSNFSRDVDKIISIRQRGVYSWKARLHVYAEREKPLDDEWHDAVRRGQACGVQIERIKPNALASVDTLL